MNKRKWLSLPIVLAILLSACGFSDPDEETDTSTENTEERSDLITIANPADITTLDPQDNSVITTSAVLVNIYNNLVKRDATGEIIPDLATDWEQMDETTWEFTLTEGVTFHNGDDLTAEDVKFSLERVANDNTLQQYSIFNHIEEIDVIDDYTIQMKTEEPDPQLLSRLATVAASVFPASYFEEVGSEEFFNHPIGTGPYEFSEWARDNFVKLTKFADYFEGEPNWGEVEFTVVPEDSTRVAELLTNEVDIAFNIPTADMDRINDNEGTHVSLEPIQRVIQLWLSTDEGDPTSDPLVREAIDLAIDNQVIIDEILLGAATPTRTHVTPGNFGSDDSLYDTYEYDPEQAKALLEEAGYEDGVTVDISVNNYYTEMAEVVGGMLREVGITANLELLEQSQFAQRLFDEDLNEGVFVGWGNDLFDGSVLELFEETNVTSYANEEVDDLLNEAAYNMDEEERAAQYQEVQQILAEDRGAVYLFQLEGRYGVSDRINYTPRLDELYVVDEITLNE